LSETRITQLITVTAYNLESRYPDEKRSFREKCTEDFTKKRTFGDQGSLYMVEVNVQIVRTVKKFLKTLGEQGELGDIRFNQSQQ